MADTTNNSGGTNPLLAFLLGAVIIVLAVVGYFVMTGNKVGPSQPSINVNVPTPKIPTPAGN